MGNHFCYYSSMSRIDFQDWRSHRGCSTIHLLHHYNLISSSLVLHRILKSDRKMVIIPQTAIPFLQSDTITELLNAYSEDQMINFGCLEIELNRFKEMLTRDQVEEVKEINGNFGKLGSYSFGVSARASRRKHSELTTHLKNSPECLRCTTN